MITTFGNKGTEDFFHGVESKAAEKVLPRNLWPVGARKLDALDVAIDVMDLKTPPGNKLEKLKGDLAGFYSIRINQQYRVIFKFSGGNASEVAIVDYH